MKIEQIYTGCLAQGAYYIESDGEVAIIDPLRESQPYIDRIEKAGATAKYIFETHFHADFVSGHVELSDRTGATIVYGPGAKTDFEFHEATDGEVFKLGKLTIKVLHTPGHTLESSSFLLFDEDGKEHALFSGDTLFIGDVGRPDLAQKGTLTQEGLAGMLYDSLRTKIMTLPDDVTVYPAHGAGSACGKNMSSETHDLLKNQKATNYALRADMTRDEFIQEVTDGLMPPPNYFGHNVALNKSGAQNIEEVMKTGNVALDVDTFEAMANHEGAMVLDTRNEVDFAKGHVPNSIFIGIDGDFAPWVGALISDLKQPIIFVTDEGRSAEVITRLSRVGYDNTLGYLSGGVAAWKAADKEVATIKSISADEFSKAYKAGELAVMDVRKPSEYTAEHVEGAMNFPLDFINSQMGELDQNKHYHIHCAGGYRSIISASIFKSRGYHGFTEVAGGFDAIKETEVATTEFVCPSTL